MRFLLDQCLSPQLARFLSAAGHDAIHVRDLGMSSSEDSVVLARADAGSRALITADTDFARILTLGSRRSPSCILFRGDFTPAAADQARLLLGALHTLEARLAQGAIVVMSKSRIRIRNLPVVGE